MNALTQPPAGRKAQKETTRARLLAEGRRLFAQRGYEATTIRDVAAAAEVAVGTVFVHFPDKGALLSAALDDQLAQALGQAMATLPSRGARRRVRHVLGAVFKSYAKHPALSRVLLKELLFAQGAPRAAARAGVEAFLEQLEGWCREPGALRPGLAPRDAAQAIFAAYLAALLDGLGDERPRPGQMLALVERLTAPWFNPKEGARP